MLRKLSKRTVTRVILMGATLAVALLPVFLTGWHEAAVDGGFLLLATAFLADCFLRLLDPKNNRGNWTLFFSVLTFILIMLTVQQYSPIISQSRQEKIALQESLQKDSLEPLKQFEMGNDQDKMKRLSNSSLPMLAVSILAEFCVIIFLED